MNAMHLFQCIKKKVDLWKKSISRHLFQRTVPFPLKAIFFQIQYKASLKCWKLKISNQFHRKKASSFCFKIGGGFNVSVFSSSCKLIKELVKGLIWKLLCYLFFKFIFTKTIFSLLLCHSNPIWLATISKARKQIFPGWLCKWQNKTISELRSLVHITLLGIMSLGVNV